MKLERVKRLSALKRILYWIGERQKIRCLKDQGASKPWTDDPILQGYRFCNVVRMEDKVSHWLLDQWYLPNFGHQNMLLACALARFINLPESLAVIGFPKKWEPERIKRELRAYRDLGNKVFNGAYMVRGNDGMDKIECVVDYYVSPLKGITIHSDSFQETWEAILPSYGMGSFMAGQITADLRQAYPGLWEGADQWAPMGPGSARGMNRLLGLAPKTPMTQELFEIRLTWFQGKVRESDTDPWILNRMEAIDYQNCLCEFDKYERVLWGEGRPKALYPGAKE